MLLHAATIVMSHKQPSRSPSLIESLEIYGQTMGHGRILSNPSLYRFGIIWKALINNFLGDASSLNCLGTKRNTALMEYKNVRGQNVLPAIGRKPAA